MPHRAPITIVVGSPIPVPTGAALAQLRETYFGALGRLFEEHKAECGFPEHTLVWTDECG